MTNPTMPDREEIGECVETLIAWQGHLPESNRLYEAVQTSISILQHVQKHGLALSEEELKKEMDSFISVGANNLGMMLTIEHRDKLAKAIAERQLDEDRISCDSELCPDDPVMNE